MVFGWGEPKRPAMANGGGFEQGGGYLFTADPMPFGYSQSDGPGIYIEYTSG
jgi:hypothetical protein